MAPIKKSRWFTDPVCLFIVAVGGTAFFWTLRRYPPPPPPLPFPRSSADFRSAPDLAAAKAVSLAKLAEQPDTISAHVDLAIACFEGGTSEYVKGLEFLERARDLGALDERLFYYAGVMYNAQGLSEYAVPEFEKFLRWHPGDLEARLRLANVYYQMDELDKSIEAYRLVLEGKPNDLLVSYNLAMAYRDKKNWSEGLAALNAYLGSGKPLPAGGHKLLGDLYRGAGDARGALIEYEKERADSGESTDLASGMAAAHQSLGETDAAIERWKKCWSSIPQTETPAPTSEP
ncbi:MAG: tetratricopeptide repeat protein [Elusimicrobia bacterium]|nr:tetratricopeptide repeat protein [Elusimicrobiota bacterium]